MSYKNNLNVRWFYLATGVFAMLFSGVLYAWSILKIPFKEAFGWADSVLSLNFTLTMCFFCLSAFFGSLICKKTGPKLALIISGILVGVGFISTGFLKADLPYLIYLTYAIIAGTGIGISYNVVVSTVCAWFPDKKGFCSGCLMMGFGISTLLLGSTISVLFENASFGWSKTYILIGAVIASVIIIAGIILTIFAAGITLLAVMLHSLPVCIIGLCLTGLSYGSCPTMTSAFTASFYGQKYFPVNYSLTNFNLILAAFIANFSNSLLSSTGGYTAPFIMLLVLAVCALGLNFSVKKP